MRRQIFRQMKQKAEWILDVFTSIFVKYESLFRIWRMQIASSDFLRDEGKNGENPLWIFEYFPEISRKICTQDACGKIRNRLWREICKQMACKVARRSLCGIAAKAVTHLWRCAAAFFVCGFFPLGGGGVLVESFAWCARLYGSTPQSACGCQLSTRHALRVPFQGSPIML